MTEIQAEERLRKLLKMTKERGTTRAEQESATRRIGEILQKFPQLRDMITEVEAPLSSASASSHQKNKFWQGVAAGIIGTLAVGASMLIMSSRGDNVCKNKL